ncbi:MAG: hypothetical protein F4Z28_18750 [Gammaproteobacteria bacterium]|nr:hypothetical protein [Gammaproteobacteria bacterium]
MLLAILLPGWLIHSFVWGIAKLAAQWLHVPPVESDIAVIVNTNACLLLAFAAGLLTNRKIEPDMAAHFIAEASGDLIECVLLKAWASGEAVLVELVMESGKAYIGFPINTGIGTLGESDVSIIPLMSGYRRPNNKRLKITVYYQEPLRKAGRDGLLDFLVALPKDRIVSARRFDLDVYEQSFGGSIHPPEEPQDGTEVPALTN